MLSILLLAFAADLAPPQMPALPEPVSLSSPARHPGCNADDLAFMLTLGGSKHARCAACGDDCDCGSVCRCAVSKSVLVPRAHEAVSKPDKVGVQYTDSKSAPQIGKKASKFQSAPVCGPGGCQPQVQVQTRRWRLFR